ncbi:unnamed protein product, partial [Staurois parvus]
MSPLRNTNYRLSFPSRTVSVGRGLPITDISLFTCDRYDWTQLITLIGDPLCPRDTAHHR